MNGDQALRAEPETNPLRHGPLIQDHSTKSREPDFCQPRTASIAAVRQVPRNAGAIRTMQRLVGNQAVSAMLAIQRCGSIPPDECSCHDLDPEGGRQSEPGSERVVSRLVASRPPNRVADRLPPLAPRSHGHDGFRGVQEATAVNGVRGWQGAVPHVGCRAPIGYYAEYHELQRGQENVQRDEPGLREDDPRLNDPGFLICTAFCYLGVPPSIFKDLIAGMLECLSTEMHAADASGYEQRFQAARDELASYSKVRLMGKIFRFLMHGELGPGGIIRITTRSQAIRDRILARLLAFGATHAGLVAAEAVVRKVLLVIDAVIVAGCATYCGALQIGQRIVELTDALAQGMASAMEVLGSVRDAVAGVLIDAVLSMYGQLNPLNWVLSESLTGRTRADLSVIGMTLWSQVRPGSPWSTRKPGRRTLTPCLPTPVGPCPATRSPGS